MIFCRRYGILNNAIIAKNYFKIIFNRTLINRLKSYLMKKLTGWATIAFCHDKVRVPLPIILFPIQTNNAVNAA